MINFKEKIAAILVETVEGLTLEEIRDMIEIPGGQQDG